MKKIVITKDRKTFINNEFDYTCIEIFNTDQINKFFRIDKHFFANKDNLKNNDEIFLLQYPNGGELSFDSGKIIKIEDNIIKHSVSTMNGSSGSPLIKRYNNGLIIGIHFGGEKKELRKYNLATPFDIIISELKLNCLLII